LEEGSLSLSVAPRRRRVWVSLLGAVLAALYLAAIVAGYAIYLQHAGEWFADTTLLLIAIPFTWTMNALTSGAFSMTGDETLKVVIATLFCAALAYIGGAALEGILRMLWRAARENLLPAKRGQGGA
jgi:hypothetical protein